MTTNTDAVQNELHEAARVFHNLTIGDSTVIIRPPSAEKRDAIIAAGARLRNALTAPQPSQPVEAGEAFAQWVESVPPLTWESWGRREAAHAAWLQAASSAVVLNDERAAFKAWFRDGCDKRDIGLGDEVAAWSGWQARVASPQATATEARTYTTQPGESVMGIALRQCGDEAEWRHILACNPKFSELLPSDYFPVGTVLTLPPSATHPAQPERAIAGAQADAMRVNDPLSDDGDWRDIDSIIRMLAYTDAANRLRAARLLTKMRTALTARTSGAAQAASGGDHDHSN